MKNSDSELTNALNGLGGEFRPDELAYLATTMKVEGPFRDRLAYLLHREYQAAGFVVTREWNRIDLAILDANGSPLCLVELKAMYTFDAFKNLAFFASAMSADELKAQKYAEHGTAVYSLLLVTHLGGKVLQKFIKPVKYSGDINRAIDAHGDATAVLSKSADAIDANLAGRTVVARGRVDGGTAFGLGVAVHYWLVRNDGPGKISN